jgi:hypothetical protein
MRINPATAQQAIEAALPQIRKIKAGTRRADLAEFCDQTAFFLERMQQHGTYMSVFAGTLDALGRKAEFVREDAGDLEAAA